MTLTNLIDLNLLSRFWDNVKTYINNTISEAIDKVSLIDTTFYLGTGDTASDVMINTNKYIKNKYINSDFSFTCTNKKVFFIIPITGYVLTMADIPIPVDSSQSTINGTTYNIYSTKNTYNGSFIVQITKVN